MEEDYKIDYQNYDHIFKEALDIFNDKTLDFLGLDLPEIKEPVKTEIKHIETKTDRMDMNFLLEDETILHLEEEVDISPEDMTRFLLYHVALYHKHRKKVRTVVVTMNKKQKAERRIDTGMIQFKPKIVNIGKINGDAKLEEIKEKLRKGEEINELELIFMPVMETKKKRGEFIREIVMTEKDLRIEKQDKEKIIAMTLVAGNKFLTAEEMEEMWEDIRMFVFMDFAEKKGIEKGMEKEKRDNALKMLEDGLSYEKIAYYTDLSIEEIQELESKIKE